jgi:GT2 family glycosyltransferase
VSDGAPGPRPLVSAVVLNWNGEAFIEECLDSLAAQTYPCLEVIVVDNGSTDGSRAWLRSAWQGRRGRLIELPANLGFAEGNNVGIRAARGAYVVLLNNDAVADARWVESLVGAAEADAAVGMCASRVLVRGRESLLDSAGLLLSRDGIGRGRGRLEPDGPAYAREEEALLPSGCAALYRTAMLEEVGLFDADFFAYCEDSDLGLRARLAGWRCRYVPAAVVVHRYSGSTSAYSPFKAFQVERNRIWVMLKSFPPGLLLASVAFTAARYGLQTWGAVRGRGAAGHLARQAPWWSIAGVVVRAWMSALRRGPEMWRRRRRLRASHRVPRTEVSVWLRTYRLGLRELALKD